MDKFITAQETIAKLQIKPFQLVTLIKTGQLQAYTEYGKRIVNADTLEKRPQRTVDEIYRNQKAKQGARVLGGPGSFGPPMTENQLKQQAAAWYHDRFHNPLVIINQPPDTEPVSFARSFPDGPRVAENAMKWLFTERDVIALLPTEYAERESVVVATLGGLEEDTRSQTRPSPEPPTMSERGRKNKGQEKYNEVSDAQESFHFENTESWLLFPGQKETIVSTFAELNKEYIYNHICKVVQNYPDITQVSLYRDINKGDGCYVLAYRVSDKQAFTADTSFLSFSSTFTRTAELSDIQAFGDKPFTEIVFETNDDEAFRTRIVPGVVPWIIYEAPHLRPASTKRQPSAPAKEEKGDNYFIKSGDYWEIRFAGGAKKTVKDLRGIKYIVRLLERPGRSIPVLTLMNGIEGPLSDPTEYNGIPAEQLHDGGMHTTGEVIPNKTNMKQFEKEVRKLAAELEELKKNGSPMEIEEAQKEFDKHVEYAKLLKSEKDPQIERERKRISKLIKEAITAIGKKDVSPELGQHLKETIATGFSCTYTPKEEPIEWHLEY